MSLLEAHVAQAVRQWDNRVFIVDLTPHGSRSVAADPDPAPVPDPVLEPEGVELPGLERVRSLLEDGAGHLQAAVAVAREQARQAAVQARKLAAFARCRPAALLDRPENEVGAAAAGSRAARPEVLAEVSEWAVDEVSAALWHPIRRQRSPPRLRRQRRPCTGVRS